MHGRTAHFSLKQTVQIGRVAEIAFVRNFCDCFIAVEQLQLYVIELGAVYEMDKGFAGQLAKHAAKEIGA